MISNLSHKNGLCSIFTLAKLTNVLEPFTKRKLSEFELNLFKNFYKKEAADDNGQKFSFFKVEEEEEEVATTGGKQSIRQPLKNESSTI